VSRRSKRRSNVHPFRMSGWVPVTIRLTRSEAEVLDIVARQVGKPRSVVLQMIMRSSEWQQLLLQLVKGIT